MVNPNPKQTKNKIQISERHDQICNRMVEIEEELKKLLTQECNEHNFQKGGVLMREAMELRFESDKLVNLAKILASHNKSFQFL